LPDFGVVDWGWHEHLRYQIYPPLWEVGDHLLYMHAATLDGLPDDVREEFLAIVAEVDDEAYDLFNQFAAEELPELRDAGIQPVEVSEETWRSVQEIQWNEALAELHSVAPDNADRLEEASARPEIRVVLRPITGHMWPALWRPTVKSKV
jgi:TRAP-type mannitol/chloroaromatic compound transport system substrate-binding protein